MVTESSNRGGAVSDLREDDVVSYVPADRFDRWWCREGTAVVRADGRLVDTYWGSGSDNHVLTDAEAETAEVKFNLGDFDELPRYDRSQAGVWQRYAPGDRGRIPSQHGLEARYFIRKGASEDHATKVQNARDKLDEAESNLRSAQWSVDLAKRELDELTAAASPVGT